MKKMNIFLNSIIFASFLTFSCNNFLYVTLDQALKLDKVPPEPLTSLELLPSDRSCSLTWNEPNSNDFKFTEILYYYTDDETPDIQRLSVNKGANAVIIKNLQNGRKTTFSLRTVDYAGNRSTAVDGAVIPAGKNTAIITKRPPMITHNDNAEFIITGIDVVSYRYRLVNLTDNITPEWSNDCDIFEKLTIDLTDDAVYQIEILGTDSENTSQDENFPTVYKWLFDSTPPEAENNEIWLLNNYSRLSVNFDLIESMINDNFTKRENLLFKIQKELEENNWNDFTEWLNINSTKILSLNTDIKDTSFRILIKDAADNIYTHTATIDITGRLYTDYAVSLFDSKNNNTPEINNGFTKVLRDRNGAIINAGYIDGGTANYSYHFGYNSSNQPIIFTLGTTTAKKGLIAKYNANGTIEWARIISGAGDCEILDIGLDQLNNIYAVGYLSGTDDYNILGTSNIINPATEYDGKNYFIVCLNSDGVYQWQYTPYASSEDSALTSIKNGDGKLFITGYFIGGTNPELKISLNGSVSITPISQGKNPLLITYTISNSTMAAFSLTGINNNNSDCEFTGITTAGTSLIISGIADPSTTYTFYNNLTITTPAGGRSIILLKTDGSQCSDGWTLTSAQANTTPTGFSVAGSPGAEEIYMTGFTGTGNYNFGNSITLNTGTAKTTGFILKFNNTLVPQAIIAEGLSNNDSRFYDVDIDNNYIYIAGDFKNEINLGSVTLDPNDNFTTGLLLVIKKTDFTPLWGLFGNNNFGNDTGLNSFRSVYSSNSSVFVSGYYTRLTEYGKDTANCEPFEVEHIKLVSEINNILILNLK